MKDFNGTILFLDRSDINTDEIIPARYLTEVTKEALTPYLLEDLKLDGFDPAVDIEGKSVVITRDNFGCGSSREHAPWAFEMNGITMVIASGFARIFRQNMFNCGMMAIQLDSKTMDHLFEHYANKETTITTDINAGVFTVTADGESETIPFILDDFSMALVTEGGWVEYADKKY